MGLASRKTEQLYFQGMMSVNWAILVWFSSLDVSLFQTKGTQGGYTHCQCCNEIMLMHSQTNVQYLYSPHIEPLPHQLQVLSPSGKCVNYFGQG